MYVSIRYSERWAGELIDAFFQLGGILQRFAVERRPSWRYIFW